MEAVWQPPPRTMQETICLLHSTRGRLMMYLPYVGAALPPLTKSDVLTYRTAPQNLVLKPYATSLGTFRTRKSKRHQTHMLPTTQELQLRWVHLHDSCLVLQLAGPHLHKIGFASPSGCPKKGIPASGMTRIEKSDLHCAITAAIAAFDGNTAANLRASRV